MKSVKTRRTEHNGKEYWTCCFCEKIFTGFGNNPDTHRDDDECCDHCNNTIVLPLRMGEIFGQIGNSFNRGTAWRS